MNGGYSDVDIMRERWKAQPDNLIGGWCITLDRAGTPADGLPTLADFVSGQVAEHIVMLHNDWLSAQD